jgi:hypothetical protein
VLSSSIGTGCSEPGDIPSSIRSCRIEFDSLVASVSAAYSASVVDSVTALCNYDFHDIGPPPRMNKYPLVDF